MAFPHHSARSFLCNSMFPGPTTPLHVCTGLGFSPFARHYSENTFFSSGYLDVSVPQVPSAYPIDSDKGTVPLDTVGFPIRISPDRRLFTAPRGFSQCPAAFIGTWRQGIHRKLLVASPRDAENSMLFLLFVFGLLLSFFFCSVVKVLTTSCEFVFESAKIVACLRRP